MTFTSAFQHHKGMNMSRFTSLTLTVLFVMAWLASCGSPSVGVVLWSDNTDALQHGDIIEIVSEGQETSVVKSLQQENQPNVSLSNWRFQLFESREEAASFQLSYMPYARTTAVSQRNALPVRSEPRANSPSVYRLHEGEEIKIINQADEPSQEGSLQDFWYEVLTPVGVRGHVFGFHLQLVDPTTEIEDERDELLDEQLQVLLTAEWRPREFQTMVNERRIHLDRLNARYGLFFDADAQRIDIVTYSDSYVYGFDEVHQLNSRKYLFSGSDVTVEFRSDDEILVQFPVGTRMQSQRFVQVEYDIHELKEKEYQRRNDLIARLLADGTTLNSTAYGTIEFDDSGAFTWIGYDRLQPRIIPSAAQDTGIIEFNHFTASSLQSQYDGAIAYSFEGTADPVIFLYELVNGGLRLTHAPDSSIRNRVVEGLSSSPTILFFQYE